MVGALPILIALNVCQENPPTFEELFPKGPPPPIVSVRTVGESETRIKPCFAFTIIFEVTLAEEAVRTQWPKITRKASMRVQVNGREYRNMLSEGSTNTACVFTLLWPQPVGREAPLRSAERALISATCQFDLKERGCLFEDAGEYHLEFFFAEQTLEASVEVLAPTPEERRIIKELNALQMLLLLIDPTDHQYATPKNIATLEGLLAIPGSYSDMLSLTVGVAKGRRVGRPLWNKLTDEQKREELEERYHFLEPVVKKERLVSRLAGLAAFELAKVADQLVRLEKVPEKRTEYSNVSMELLQKVADCPLVPHEQALAKKFLVYHEQEGK